MYNNEYETFYVARSELPTDEMTRISDRVMGIIEKHKGSLLVSEDWGRRRLAYPISRQTHGHYIYINYVGPADLAPDLERTMRLEDNLIRFMTLKLADNIDVDAQRQLAEERTRARAEKRAAAEAEAEERARLEAEYAEKADELTPVRVRDEEAEAKQANEAPAEAAGPEAAPEAAAPEAAAPEAAAPEAAAAAESEGEK